MRRIVRYLPLCFLALGSVQFAAAQSSFDLNMGFGSFHDKAQTGGIDSQTGAYCTSGSTCVTTPSMSGFFLGFGGDLMLKKHYGIGAEWVLTPAKSDYANFGANGTERYRQHFIDVDGIYAPINEKKVVVKLAGGIGAAKTSFSISQTSCLGNTCLSQSSPFTSANHLDVHFGAGVEVFVTDHIFIRPQFDLHYAPNLTNQFGSNVPVGGMVWVGYSWGDR